MNEHVTLPFIKISNQFKYSTTLAVTGAVRGTSREKIYQELGFESLQKNC